MFLLKQVAPQPKTDNYARSTKRGSVSSTRIRVCAWTLRIQVRVRTLGRDSVRTAKRTNLTRIALHSWTGQSPLEQTSKAHCVAQTHAEAGGKMIQRASTFKRSLCFPSPEISPTQIFSLTPPFCLAPEHSYLRGR